MRWPACLILAYVAVGVQVGLAAVVGVRGVGPNLPLLVVVFVGLNATAAEAAAGGLVVGALQDLATVQPLGLYAFGYGATAVVVARVAEHVRRGHPLTHVALALVGGAITGVMLVAHGWVHPTPARVGPRVAVVSALYTAVLAPVVIGPLDRARRAFGFDAAGGRRGRRG